MRTFRQIVHSENPPSIQDLWVDSNEIIRGFINGEWTVLAKGIDSPGMKELEEKVDHMDKEIDDLFKSLGSSQGIISLDIGDTEDVKAKNLEKLKTVQNNNGDNTFFVDISYGYGTGTWHDGVGGSAFIITAKGSAKTYSLGKDGSVSAGTDVDLAHPNTELFKIVIELPEAANADKGKIYCVKSTSASSQSIEAKNAVTLKETYDTKAKAAQAAQDTLNRYIEYIAIEETVGGAKVWNWEKVGEFNATPDLSDYARLSGAEFRGPVIVSNYIVATSGIKMVNGKYLPLYDNNGKYFKPNCVLSGDGGVADIGLPENFTFTLEDGSTVTKSIRVVSTTTTPAT